MRLPTTHGDADHPRRGPRRRLRRHAAILENVNFDVRARRGVRHPRRLGLRQEHAAEAHDRALCRRWRARCGSTATTSSPPTARRARAILRKFGVMYQSGALFGSMTLLENVRLPLEVCTDLPDDAIDLIARMKLELVGLEGSSPGTCRPRSPAACRSAPASRARWRSTRRSCSSTSRRRASTRSPPRRSTRTIRRLADNLGVTFVIVTHDLAQHLRRDRRPRDPARPARARASSPKAIRASCATRATIRACAQFFRREAEAACRRRMP